MPIHIYLVIYVLKRRIVNFCKNNLVLSFWKHFLLTRSDQIKWLLGKRSSEEVGKSYQLKQAHFQYLILPIDEASFQSVMHEAIVKSSHWVVAAICTEFISLSMFSENKTLWGIKKCSFLNLENLNLHREDHKYVYFTCMVIGTTT